MDHPLASDAGLPFQDETLSALASFLIRKLQKQGRTTLTSKFFASLRNQSLPTPAEPCDTFLLWMAEQMDGRVGRNVGQGKNISDPDIRPEIGAIDAGGPPWVIQALKLSKLLDFEYVNGTTGAEFRARLSPSGWARVEALEHTHIASRFAFFARKFANADLDIAAMDLFVVPTIGLDLLYAYVKVRLDRIELVWINVTTHPTAEWVARQITEAFSWNEAPQYMIRDRDRIYGAAVTRRLRAMGMRDKPIAPSSPWQNSFAKQLIGSIRRVFGSHHRLGRGASASQSEILRPDYNGVRMHQSLNKDAPVSRAVKRTGAIRSRAILSGLHHHYRRI